MTGRRRSLRELESVLVLGNDKNAAQISRLTNIPEGTVYRWLSVAGLNMNRAEATRIKKYTSERARAISMARDGESGCEISRELGISQPVIWDWLRRAGVGKTRAESAKTEKRLMQLRNSQKLATIKARGINVSWPEARFYGLVFGDPITTEGFSAQQWDGYGVYDGAWTGQKIIVELDGEGHHAFGDRSKTDVRKDIARMLEYNTVLREEDENILFLKALAILESGDEYGGI